MAIAYYIFLRIAYNIYSQFERTKQYISKQYIDIGLKAIINFI